MPVGFSSGDSDFGTVEKTGGAKIVTLDVSQMPSHQHQLKLQSGTGQLAWTSGGEYQTWTNDAPKTGEGKAHGNIQPYQVAYFWKRTA